MTVWVWDGDDVLADWSAGIVVVIGAETEEDAWAALDSQDATAALILREHKDRPRKITAPEVLVHWGGS